MLRLLRFLIGLFALGVFVWFGATVTLGEHTLFGHFRRIWHAKETQDLVDGAKEKVNESSRSPEPPPAHRKP